ncbi:MAG TPA: DUF1990 domain-containing protein [Nocardioides sp.]|nr:DUF1990 domain-containing protein [Nocardioides sp.]
MDDRTLPTSEVERLGRVALTYAEVGSTLHSDLPTGYGHLQRSREIGAGTTRFEQAAGTLLRWEMHRRAGIDVRSSTERVVPGAVAVLRLGVGRLAVKAPVRILQVVDEPSRKGFAYGTLSGHPESGEEAFVVELHHDDTVTFTITAFSRPATLLSRAGGQLTGAVQSWVTNRYLRSV